MDGIKNRAPITPAAKPQQPSVTSNIRNIQKDTVFITKQENARIQQQYEKKFNRGKNIKRISKILFLLVLLGLMTYVAFFGWKLISTAKKMQSSNNGGNSSLSSDMKAIISPIIPSAEKKLKGEDTGRINILLLGAAGEHNAGKNLTDTIMVMSIDTKNKKVALLSLPRDLYVNIPNSQSFTKINSLYQIGLKENLGTDLIKQTVEKIIAAPINYYLVVDFDGFKKIIDDIDGINITSGRDIYDPRYPGPNYSYETFSLSKGFHLLDGATALKYVRERHDDPEGDFGRAKRQQQVIQAVKSKLFSMETFFNANKLNDVLNTLGDNIKTDIDFEEIASFIALSKTLDTQNINNVVVDAWKPDSLLKVSHVLAGNVMAFILVPRVGNYSEIQDLQQNIFDQSAIKKRQASIATEDATIEIINESGDSRLENKIRQLLIDNLNMKDVRITRSKNEEISEKTIVTDNTAGSKIFTSDELIKKLPAAFSSDPISQSKADITITLGKDLIQPYEFETDSVEDYNKAQEDQADLIF